MDSGQENNIQNGNADSYNFNDQDLIRQLIQSRMSQGQKLEVEDLSGYELPPRSQFSMLSKPAVTFKYGQMTFSMASVRLFEACSFILTPVHRGKKRMSVVPCTEEEASSLQWSRKRQADGMVVNRGITSREFIAKIYRMMGWSVNCRYKVMGRLAIGKPYDIPILVFDLEEAIMFDSKPVEIVNEETGEIKKQQVMYYPDRYKDCIGKSYTDYMEGKQMTMFEYLDEYTGKSYADLPDEDPIEKKVEQSENSLNVENKAAEPEDEVFLPNQSDSDKSSGIGGGGYFGG